MAQFFLSPNVSGGSTDIYCSRCGHDFFELRPGYIEVEFFNSADLSVTWCGRCQSVNNQEPVPLDYLLEAA